MERFRLCVRRAKGTKKKCSKRRKETHKRHTDKTKNYCASRERELSLFTATKRNETQTKTIKTTTTINANGGNSSLAMPFKTIAEMFFVFIVWSKWRTFSAQEKGWNECKMMIANKSQIFIETVNKQTIVMREKKHVATSTPSTSTIPSAHCCLGSDRRPRQRHTNKIHSAFN